MNLKSKVETWKQKDKQDETRSSKSVTTKINDKSQGVWKSVNTHYVVMKGESGHEGSRFFLNPKTYACREP
jgi:hypothetical protein